ncbi:Npt1/Npt2 family nucleotide transporter [Thermodesulfobacteriota bacterium]
MIKTLSKWLNIYDDEIALFAWTALLLFLIRTSNILFNNFAETAFLKRFGVEYLPIVYIANSISTFVIMGFITGFMARLPGTRLLSYMLLFCGSSVAGLRFVIPLGFDLLYPVLFVLKSQYEVLLALVFWNLANDLFNTRQSKRLFPLITAGGVLGGVIGSFGTPLLAREISLDNLMFVYLGTTLIAATAVWRMGNRFPTLLLSEKKDGKKKSRPSMKEEFKKVLPMIKESKLVKILIMLTLMPNLVIPILNYQFNFAIDQNFATEGGMIKFFGYFRGTLNIVSLIILLFVGRVYGRWGLPVALMFHPINYMLVFVAFLFRFDIFTAMYARISTTILRTTMNVPANAVLVGIVPAEYRGVVRPFLRGTVVRIGVLIGSGFIMLSEGLLHPRYLSAIAVVFVGGWIATSFVLKKSYSKILLDLISKNMLDLKSMEDQDVGHVFADKKMRTQLIDAFLAARGEDCVWYARLLKSLGEEELDSYILKVLKSQDDETRIGLLGELSPRAGEEALPVFQELLDPVKPKLMIALLKAANRIPDKRIAEFNLKVYNTVREPEVRAYAISGLYPYLKEKSRKIINTWLNSEKAAERRAGIIAAGASGDSAYVPVLQKKLGQKQDSTTLPLVLSGLANIGSEEVNASAFPFLQHSSERVRLSALDAVDIKEDDDLRRVVHMMGDPSEAIHEQAKEKILASSHRNPEILVESLTIPRRNVREGIFDLLESENVSDLEFFRFARSQLEKAYVCIAEAESLRSLPEGQERELLIDHLNQQRRVYLENILRVLAAQDRTGEMRVIWRGVFSADSRQKSNSLEALDDVMDISLSTIMIPLLEGDLSDERCLEIGRKKFQLPDFNSDQSAMYSHFISKEDWVTVALGLYLIARKGAEAFDRAKIEELTHSQNTHIRQMAQHIIDPQPGGETVRGDSMEKEITIPDKIIHLKGIHIFEGLSVSELAAVASVTEEAFFAPSEIVIKEGDPGESMYLIIGGKVSVLKGHETDHEIELDQIGVGDYFGEMALFEGDVRSATIRTLEESRLLELHKREFTEIVREYPQIALHICKVLSQRMRELHQKIQIN